MTFPFFDAPPREPSQFVGFAGNTIDRQSEQRSDDSAREGAGRPAARLMLVRGGGGSILKKAGDGFDPPISPPPEAEALAARSTEAILLGHGRHARTGARGAAWRPRSRGASARRSRRSTTARSTCRAC